MAVITDTELKEQIKSGALDRVYFLYGTEQYIKRKYLYALIEAATDGQPNSFSYAVFEQKNFSADTLHDFISILPFGTDRKCAVISDVDFSCMPQSEADKLAAAINDIPEFCTVLFYCNTAEPVNPPSEKADSKIFDGKKTKQKNRFAEIMKLCERLGCVVKFEAKSDPEIVQFLTRYAAKQGSRMHPTTARYLIENCGNDLQSLINETDKLCMLCMHSEITDKDIDLICPRTLESNVFRITDAISAGNADRAVAVMSDLFAAKVSSDQILGALSAS
ncbi:MAG: DNA polymerase III subunit delta, partial [Acutalibacteraceae bacterium]